MNQTRTAAEDFNTSAAVRVFFQVVAIQMTQ
jgi:hypothetical protein